MAATFERLMALFARARGSAESEEARTSAYLACEMIEKMGLLRAGMQTPETELMAARVRELQAKLAAAERARDDLAAKLRASASLGEWAFCAAKYKGRCSVCIRDIRVGEDIAFLVPAPGERARSVRHARCHRRQLGEKP